MPHRLRLCFIGLCMLFCASSQASEQTDRIDRLFSAWSKSDTPGAALAVIRDGQVVYARGYGQANLEYAIPITPKTIFHVASLSKQFTAFAIHLLAQEGRLSIEDDIAQYVPEMRALGPIKIRHLLHHTSGLRDQWDLLTLAGLRLDDVVTEGDVLGLLFPQRQLNFAPGEEELYSNSGYAVLALIVKRVTGKPFAEFARERIFKPLGMNDSHVQESYGTLVPGRAYSYRRTPEGYRYVALSYSNTGPTSVFTTVEDLARWDRNFETAEVGGPAVRAAMLARERLNGGREIGYASGLNIGRYRALPTVEHAGADAGYRTYLLRFPEQRLAVVVLANAADVNAGALAHRVADVYLEGAQGLGPVNAFPAEIDLPMAGSSPYLGDFELRPGLLLRFTSEGRQLMVQGTGQPKFPMYASADNAFFTKAFEASVVFDAPNGQGRTDTATWKQGGQEIPLVRVTRFEPSAAQLSACVGEFYSEELRTLYALSVEDGKLLIRYPRGQLPLTPLTADVYAAPYPIRTVTLRRTADGGCDGLRVHTGRVRNLFFQKVRLEPAS